MTPDPSPWKRMRLGVREGSDSWLLAWVMTEVCCKDSSEVNDGGCLVLRQRLSAGGYNGYC